MVAIKLTASFPIHVQSVGFLLVFPRIVYQFVYTPFLERNLDIIIDDRPDSKQTGPGPPKDEFKGWR